MHTQVTRLNTIHYDSADACSALLYERLAEITLSKSVTTAMHILYCGTDIIVTG